MRDKNIGHNAVVFFVICYNNYYIITIGYKFNLYLCIVNMYWTNIYYGDIIVT